MEEKAISKSKLALFWGKVKALVNSAVQNLYTKPSGGIPKSDMSSEVQTSLGKADSALQEHQDISGKQDVISDLAAIRSGAQAGSTALQPNDVPSWAKQSSKPSYTASEVGALPDTTKYAGSQSVGGAANKAVSIPFGQVDSTSTSTAFTATVEGITELRDGVCCWIRNNVTGSATGCTLNINGLGAKPIYSSVGVANVITTHWSKGNAILFIYNSTKVEGGCWDFVVGYDSNTDVVGCQLRYDRGDYASKTVLYTQHLVFQCSETELLPVNTENANANTNKVLTTESFNPFGIIGYYIGANKQAGGTLSADQTWLQRGIDLRQSFNTGNTLIMNKDVYMICTPQSDGMVKLASSPISQELPTTEDGKVYIYLGAAFNANSINLSINHPIYYFKDGAIRQWTNSREDVLKQSINQLDAVVNGGDLEIENITFTNGGYVNYTSGGIVSGVNTLSYSDYLIIEDFVGKYLEYTRYSATGSTLGGIAFYDSSKAFISGEIAATNQTKRGFVVKTIEIPNGAKYVRFTSAYPGDVETDITQFYAKIKNASGLVDKITDGSVTKLTKTTIGGTTQGIYLNQGVPAACESYDMWYMKHIAALYGATRNDATGLWSYYYKRCARWDDTNEQIVWDRNIGYDDITDEEMMSMVDFRLVSLYGNYGSCKDLRSRIGFHFIGYGNNQIISGNAYIGNRIVQTYGYVGSTNIGAGESYAPSNLNDLNFVNNIRHFIGKNNKNGNHTAPSTATLLEYATIPLGGNNQQIDFSPCPLIEFVCIYFTITSGDSYTGCKLILHPDVYAKIFDSTNADYTLWHKIDLANQARTNPITIQSA